MIIKKSKIEKIKELEKWNDLYKFEMHFEDGTEGFMFKKTQDPMCSVFHLNHQKLVTTNGVDQHI